MEQIFLEAQQSIIKDTIQEMNQQMRKQMDSMKTWVQLQVAALTLNTNWLEFTKLK